MRYGLLRRNKNIREGKNLPRFKFNEPKVEGNTSNKKASAIYMCTLNTLSTDSASSNPFRSKFMYEIYQSCLG